MFKFTLTDSETYNRGTGYGKTVRPVLRGDRWSNPLFYLNCTQAKQTPCILTNEH